MFQNLIIPKPPGIYFFFDPPDYDPGKNWLHRIVYWPRMYKDWMNYIDELRRPIFGDIPSAIPVPPGPTYIPNTIPDVWFHRDIAADMLESWFRRNQWIRWQMHRVAMAIRRRIMDKRIIGEVDVGTMDVIPPRHLVEVYDWPTRSKYRFHANTIHGNMLAALRYYSVAISMPKAPKNPYTNLPWTMGQMWVLVDQIQRRFWDTGHRHIDPVLQVYSAVGFSLDNLRCRYGRQLDVDCARRFFRDRTSEYWEVIYSETLIDVFSLVTSRRSYFLRNLIVDRSLSQDLLVEWDDAVTTFWCYDNLNQIIAVGAVSITDIITSIIKLVDRTEEYIRMVREARKKKMEKKKPSTP